MKVDEAYVIRYTGKDICEPLFWNNETGFGSLLTANLFTKAYRQKPANSKYQLLCKAILDYNDYQLREYDE